MSYKKSQLTFWRLNPVIITNLSSWKRFREWFRNPKTVNPLRHTFFMADIEEKGKYAAVSEEY